MKIRVLASPFQLELIRRMGGSPIAMTLADVLPGLQQGTIDGTLTTMTIYTTMHYYDAGKFVINTDQPYVNSIGVMSKKWMDTLPPDLQKVVDDAGAKVTAEITPFVKDFFAEQDQDLVSNAAAQIADLPKDEHDAMIKKVSTIGDDLSKSKPALNEAVKALFDVGGAPQVAAAAARMPRDRARPTPGWLAVRRSDGSNRRLQNDSINFCGACAALVSVLRVAGRRAAGRQRRC